MEQSRIEESGGLQIDIPWNGNTARSFGLALVLNAIMLWLFMTYADLDISQREIQPPDRIPSIIVLGLGDGTGISKGNVQKEGAQRAGQERPTPLEDAERAPTSPEISDNANTSEHPNAIPNIVRERRAQTATREDDAAREGSRDVGRSISDPDAGARGLGDFGGGVGSGEGFGDVEWGGGGNRIVLQKKLPSYARGVNRSVEVRLKFTVSPEGRVTSVMPIRQGEPALATRAIQAMKQWRFGPIAEKKDMAGFITFTFRI